MKNYLKLQYHRFRTLYAFKTGDWEKVPFKKSNEPLFLVPEDMTFSYYSEILKLLDEKEIYIRKQVLEKLLLAQSILKNFGFDLRVYSGWHSVKFQNKLFWYYMKENTAKLFNVYKNFKNSDTTEEIEIAFYSLENNIQSKMMEFNRSYVSLPKEYSVVPSPHLTGGAVNVWPYENNQPVNLGIPFDHMSKTAGAFYHLKFKRKTFKDNDSRICKNRETFLLAMIKAGFSCYGPQIWHFNFGNQMDALVKRTYAIYSYIEP